MAVPAGNWTAFLGNIEQPCLENIFHLANWNNTVTATFVQP
jgi:hypothetical protein